jgi:putative DNA primase/helicase
LLPWGRGVSGLARSSTNDKDRQTLTVESLAQAKGLPAEFLRGLGLHDLPGEGVGIPYYDSQGKEVVKKRTSLTAKGGSYWPKGLPLRAYGLDRLKDARQAGELILVEGESDCWTLWYHGLPALGIPGAKATSVLQAEHLEGISRLYLFQEPDQGGEAFVIGTSHQLQQLGWLGQVRVVQPPAGIKDVNDLHRLSPQTFTTEFHQLLTDAQPLLSAQPQHLGAQCPYQVSPQGLVWLKPTKDGPVPTPLTNF